MTDVIDSLKRLERVGSENSKTTEKLIFAAAQLSSTIVGYFPGCSDRTVVACIEREKEPKKEPPRSPTGTGNGVIFTRDTFRDISPWKHEYMIYKGVLCFRVDFPDKKNYVAANRENALAFSEDIAAGVLEAIIQTAETHQRRTAEAIPALEAVLKKK